MAVVVMVECWPAVMVAGFAAHEETTGGVLGFSSTVTSVEEVAVPPLPSSTVAVIVYLPGLNASGIPASFSAGAFNSAAGRCVLVSQRVIVRIGSLGIQGDRVFGAGKNLGRVGAKSDGRRMVGRRWRRIAAEVQHQSGRGAEVILLIVATVSELGQ